MNLLLLLTRMYTYAPSYFLPPCSFFLLPSSSLFLLPSRDLKGLFFQVALPVCVVALTLLILTIQYSPAGPSLPLSPSIYDDLNKNGAKAEVYVSDKNRWERNVF